MGIKKGGGMVSFELRNFFEIFRELDNFDYQSFERLVEDTDEETALQILARFEESLRQGIGEMNDAVQSDNPDPIWKNSHKFAGTAELLGFVQYGTIARDISVRVKAQPDMEYHRDDVMDFIALTKELSHKIRSCLNSNASPTKE